MKLFAGLLTAAAVVAGAAAHADTYPNKPVRTIVPVPAGQSTDVLMRVVAAQLSTATGQNFFVENRAGGAAIIGTQAAARSAPDGYTLVTASNGPFGINPTLHPKLPYDALKDFTAVARLGIFPQVLVVAKDSPITSADALVKAARANPGKLDFVSAGNGTTQHLTMEIFRSKLNLQVQHVPYSGSVNAVAGLMTSKNAVMFESMPAVLPFIQSGQVRALAVSTAMRSPLLPDVPTVKETVEPGFDVTTWVGVAAPAGTPPDIVKMLNAEIGKAIATPAVKARFAALAITPAPQTPEQFGEFMKAEVAKWGQAVRESGAVVE
ncbi:MAG: tripartite tricarboxylate transporter substrate binding protein [Polaromonas sp.]|nr:tripartite tricarboxylate transporter substrate binding protein [Polaromonas sp.]